MLLYECTPPPTSNSSEVTNCMHACTIRWLTQMLYDDDYHMQKLSSDDNICWQNNDRFPFDNNIYSGVSSIGIELQHGTNCTFTLLYRGDDKYYKKTAGCTGEGYNVRCS